MGEATWSRALRLRDSEMGPATGIDGHESTACGRAKGVLRWQVAIGSERTQPGTCSPARRSVLSFALSAPAAKANDRAVVATSHRLLLQLNVARTMLHWTRDMVLSIPTAVVSPALG